MPLAHRIEQEETKLLGVNLAVDETKLALGAFTRLENWIPAGVYAIKKKRGCSLLDNVSSPVVPQNVSVPIWMVDLLDGMAFAPTAGGVVLGVKYTHVFTQAGQADRLFAWATRSNQTDALFEWSTSGWVLRKELLGTNLQYQAVTWNNKLYWVDGKHQLGVYDGTNFLPAPAQAPTGLQYLVVYQARLVGGGDARLVPSEVTAENSFRNLVVYCEALDDTQWTPNNFIQTDIVGDGGVITGMGVLSTNTSDSGAQSNLCIFHSHATMVHRGTLGSGDVQLDILSKIKGTPAYRTICNTPFGLAALSSDPASGERPCVLLIEPNSSEPKDIGINISSDLANISASMLANSCMIYHSSALKLAINSGTGTANDHEWWLDMREVVFPQSENWFGPHTGDKILQYNIYRNQLVSAQNDSSLMWHLDVEGQWKSMTDQTNPRTSVMAWPRSRVQGMQKAALDAIGVMGQIAANTQLSASVDLDRGTITTAANWTSPASLSSGTPMYAVLRPTRYDSYDAKVTLQHSAGSDITIDSVYLRALQRGKQTRKQESSAQT